MNRSKAQIVATLGPATKNKDIITRLIKEQMDVARLNFSYGTYEEYLEIINNVRDAANKQGKVIPIITDLSGPRITVDNKHHYDSSAIEVITEKDLKDLEFALEHSIEYIGLSFVGIADDVIRLRNEIAKLNGRSSIIAKIERKVALSNLKEIIKAADAVMIARGDLGNEIPLEKIPYIEKTIIEKCKSFNKPVITATQMLYSMTENPKPSRAEVTDVAFAILNGSDAVMLSEETAIGKYPVESVIWMEKIIMESEGHLADMPLNPL